MKGQTYFIFALIIAILIAVFAVINVGSVQVNYLFGTGEAPLILVILGSVLMGGLITFSVGAVRFYRMKRENKSLRSQLNSGLQESTTPSRRSRKNERLASTDSENENEKHTN
ncbi:lipopolysaccharide assembly LapA domain-containing protein [Halobacillus sp. A5]|uniref:LapA family protein n=1 Tax=Halobacillus sp. A5 TaxID=2880263 RepID=UPI0020A61D58|nr:lipopolysaccharide assembly protein LapA domain-containing protein [Halobacillus sp. A5]MCP3025569.1 lipopolysaccharide assembly protein LapA domain-containing protein [Halobacillus sp. A5]